MRFSFNQLAYPIAKIAIALSLFVFANTLVAQNTDQTAAKPVAIDGVRVSEPVVHKNLAVYFLHSDKRDDREFLTLNDGLKSGMVVVTEKKQEQVLSLIHI